LIWCSWEAVARAYGPGRVEERLTTLEGITAVMARGQRCPDAAAATTSGVRLRTLNRKHYPMSDIRFYEG